MEVKQEQAIKDGVVCVCKQVSERKIRKAVREGNKKFIAVKQVTEAASGCGLCQPFVEDIIKKHQWHLCRDCQMHRLRHACHQCIASGYHRVKHIQRLDSGPQTTSLLRQPIIESNFLRPTEDHRFQPDGFEFCNQPHPVFLWPDPRRPAPGTTW